MSNNPSGNFQNTSIVDYLKGNYFATPDYQRAYAWKSPKLLEDKNDRTRYQVKEFWDDIIGWYSNKDNSDKNYYLGTIVLSSEAQDTSNNGAKDDRKNIVDGQQRLITLYILYIALAGWYREKGNKKLFEDALQKIVYIPKSDWDSEKKQYTHRLILSGDDEAHLNKLLDSIKSEEQISVDFSAEASNIGQSFEFFKKSIQGFAEDNCPSGERSGQVKVIADLEEYIERQLYAAVVVAKDDMRAHAVFETLNDRGIPLGAEDLIKNYLFSRAGAKYKTVVERWNKISELISGIDEKVDESAPDLSRFDKFIQRYMNSFTAPIQSNGKNKSWVVESSIFSSFKRWFDYRKSCPSKIVLDDERAVDLITNELVHAAHMYTALHSGEYWAKYIFEEDELVDENVRLIKMLKYVNSMDQKKNWYALLYPLFFSVLAYVDKKKESPKYKSKTKHREEYRKLKEEIMQFTNYIESYIFRSYVMKKEWGSRASRSDKFIGLSQKIREGAYDNLLSIFDEQVFDRCFSKESTIEFEKFFSTYCVYKTGRTPGEVPYVQFAKYILRKLENKRQGDIFSELKVVEYGSKASLEHIFPYEYSKGKKESGWEEFLNEKQGGYDTDYVFRVGNYAIFHGKPNSEMPNESWKEKRKYLKKSHVIHTVNIAETYDNWTPEVIDEVQRKIAAEAVEVWNSPRDKKESK